MLSCSEFVGQEDPLEKGTTTYSDILAWRIPMDGGVWQAVVHVTPWTVAWQARLSTGFSRQDTGVGCVSLLQGIFLT